MIDESDDESDARSKKTPIRIRKRNNEDSRSYRTERSGLNSRANSINKTSRHKEALYLPKI